jgi:hypothetical protein
MLLGPVQHPVVYVSSTLEEVLEHSSQPCVVWLFLELQRPHVLEVLCELILVRSEIPGSP